MAEKAKPRRSWNVTDHGKRNGFGATISDVYLKIGNETIHIETKAGNEFFTYVSSSGSNFSNQSFNMLLDVNKIENLKVPLNQTILAGLSDPTTFAKQKDQVIKAWTNWNNGALLENEQIISKFETFFGSSIVNKKMFQELLKSNDTWFDSMFKNNNL